MEVINPVEGNNSKEDVVEVIEPINWSTITYQYLVHSEPVSPEDFVSHQSKEFPDGAGLIFLNAPGDKYIKPVGFACDGADYRIERDKRGNVFIIEE